VGFEERLRTLVGEIAECQSVDDAKWSRDLFGG
jgi:hypothetical protein